MIDRFTKQDLLQLIQEQHAPCVSIYLGTEKTGREIYKPATQLKQLVEAAKTKLSGNWMADSDAERFLAPIIDLIDDEDFWQQTENGLALFLNPDGFQKWQIVDPLADQVFVSRTFFVRSIVPTAQRYEAYYILALSQNRAEFFEADESGVSRICIPEMPESVEAAMNVTSADRGSSVHTATQEHRGKQGRVYHGHGGKPDVAHEDAEYFYRQVDRAVSRFLGQSTKPLVLATVSNQAAIYQSVNRYPHLVDEFASGNPDRLLEDQLLADTLAVLQAHRDKIHRSTVAQYQGPKTIPNMLYEVSEILNAAHLGQIEKLFCHPTAPLPGSFNPVNRTIDYNCSTNDLDLDLVEDAIAQTLQHRGDVLVSQKDELPMEQPMIAKLRYQ